MYPCDKLRGSYADLAVVDCAYGSWEPEREDGRGLELLHLLHKKCPELRYYGDEHFSKQVKS